MEEPAAGDTGELPADTADAEQAGESTVRVVPAGHALGTGVQRRGDALQDRADGVWTSDMRLWWRASAVGRACVLQRGRTMYSAPRPGF
jgi:hypothetical protein